jgi:hypothetical protein
MLWLLTVLAAAAPAVSAPECRLQVDFSKLDGESSMEEDVFIRFAENPGGLKVTRSSAHTYILTGTGGECAQHVARYLWPSAQPEMSYVGVTVTKLK